MSKLIYAALPIIFVLLSSCIVIAKPVSAAPSNGNSWVSKEPMPRSEGGMRAATVNGKIYMMGGSMNYEFDTVTNSWNAKTPMLTPRNWFAMAVHQNKIYTIGGRSKGSSFDTNEVYDPLTDSWSVVKSIPTNISDIDANVIDDQIYLMGRESSQSPFAVSLSYNVATDSWINKTAMPYPVTAYASAVLDKKIYIFGGLSSSLGNQTQIYDSIADSWSIGSPIPNAVLNAGAGATTGILAPKRIYVIGGTSSLEGLNITQVYDPANDCWSYGEKMPTARLGLTVAVVNDRLYALAGSNSAVFSPSLKVIEQYTPIGYSNTEPSNSSTITSVVSLALILVLVILIFAFAITKKHSHKPILQ